MRWQTSKRPQHHMCVCLAFMCFDTYKHAGWLAMGKMKKDCRRHTHRGCRSSHSFVWRTRERERALKMIVNCRVGLKAGTDGIGRRRDKRQLTACFYLNLVILLSAHTQHSNKSLVASHHSQSALKGRTTSFVKQ